MLSQSLWLNSLYISGRLLLLLPPPALLRLADFDFLWFSFDIHLASRLYRVVISQHHQFIILTFISCLVEIRQCFELYGLLTQFFAGVQVVWYRSTRTQMSTEERSVVLTLKHHIILPCLPIFGPKTFKIEFP